MKDLDDAHLDKSLRDKLNSFGRHPSDKVWEGVQQRVAQHQKQTKGGSKVWLLPLLFIAGLALLLVGNLLPPLFQPEQQKQQGILQEHAHASGKQAPAVPAPAASVPAAASGAPARAAAPVTAVELPANQSFPHKPQALVNKPAAVAATAVAKKTAPAAANAGAVAGNEQPGAEKPAAVSVTPADTGMVAQAPAATASTDQVPQVLQQLIEAEQQVQQLQQGSLHGLAAQAQLVAALQAEKAELARLQQRADSLLAAVEYVAENLEAPAAPAEAAPQKPAKRWSVALAFAPEHSFLSLKAPESNTLVEMRKNHETGRSGFNASVMADYALSNRLSVGAGLGYSSYGAELRLTNTETIVDVRYDTTVTTTTNFYSTTHTVYSVQVDSVVQLDPIFNGNGQVTGYDTLYIPLADTTFFTVTQNDSVTSTVETITPLINKTEVTRHKVLKPNYHFVTLPVMFRYRITPGARWWADVGVGAQLQLFRGGTQLVTEDGRSYRTEKIRPREGPFRPVNLALMGNLALNYGITDHISVSVAPAVRWQTLSVYKKETGLKQKPLATGLQFGVRYAF